MVDDRHAFASVQVMKLSWPIGCTTSRLVNQSWIDSFLFRKILIELMQFLFQMSWLVIESIRFHKGDDWVDWFWGTGMIESIDLIQNIPKKLNEIERFPKKVNATEGFPKNNDIFNDWMWQLDSYVK